MPPASYPCNVPPNLSARIAQRMGCAPSSVEIQTMYQIDTHSTILRAVYHPAWSYSQVHAEYVVTDEAANSGTVLWDLLVEQLATSLSQSWHHPQQQDYPQSSGYFNTQTYQSMYSSAMAYGTQGMDSLPMTYMAPPPYQQQPKRLKAGDPVLDENGNLIGVYNGDGTIKVAQRDVVEAVRNITRDGVPVEPGTVRRAIRLSGKLSED